MLFLFAQYYIIQPYIVYATTPHKDEELVIRSSCCAAGKTYTVALEKAYEIFEQARMRCSGLGKRARFVMSHSTGKIEVVGKTEQQIFMRYHRAANPEEKAKFMVFDSDSEAYWFDDYEEYIAEYKFKKPSLIQLNW